MEKINPRVDIAFKKIFGIEENKDLLISLINATVGQEDQVVDVTLLNPYNQQHFREDKLSILDIKAQGACGRMFNIEIQLMDEGDYDKRALYYWAKLCAEQLKSSQEYSKLEKVIGIHILNFTSIPEIAKYHNVFHITEKETGIRYFDCLELHTIELTKFVDAVGEELADFAGKIKDSLDMWSAFLTRYEDLSGMKRLPIGLDRPELKKAIDVLDVMNFSVDEREAYEARLKWLRVEANTLKHYEEKGREEGITIGEERGKKEIAAQMLKKGMDVDLIAQLTGLRKEAIMALR